MNGNNTYLYNGSYAYKEGQRWILVGDIEKYFPTIPCKEYEKLVEKYRNILSENHKSAIKFGEDFVNVL